jgi:hypothetical protein
VKVAKPEGAIYGSVVAAPAFAEIARAAMMHAGVLPSLARQSPERPRLVHHRVFTNKIRT